MSLEELTEGLRPPPSLGTNARSVAESLGMPRESVRRRVQALIGDGLVDRCDNELRLSADGLIALSPVRNFLVGLSVRYFQIVSSVIADAQPYDPTRPTAAEHERESASAMRIGVAPAPRSFSG